MRKVVQAGFTLIELVVVIIILGILAAIAVPQFTDLAGEAKNAVASGACGALQSSAVLLYASKKASSTLAEIQTNVNPATNITWGGTCAGGATAQYVPATGTPSVVQSCGVLPPALCN
jgi:MSHA pilin protein MshA